MKDKENNDGKTVKLRPLDLTTFLLQRLSIYGPKQLISMQVGLLAKPTY